MDKQTDITQYLKLLADLDSEMAKGICPALRYEGPEGPSVPVPYGSSVGMQLLQFGR